MIWLIGNKGMLGSEVELLISKREMPFVTTDVEVDIVDRNHIASFVSTELPKGADWIINCSGYTAVDRAEDERHAAFNINAVGVLNIAETAKQIGATLVHISTDYVFSGKKDTEYTEEDVPDPQGIYAQSKFEGDQNVIRNLSKYYILRTSWLYGLNGSNFVKTMLKLFDEREIVRVVADQHGSPTYAKNLAEVILNILDSKTPRYGIYNYSNEGKTTWHEFAKEIYAQADKRCLISKVVKIVAIASDEYPTKSKRPGNSYLSKQKIVNTFSISIPRWQDALSDFFSDFTSPCGSDA